MDQDVHEFVGRAGTVSEIQLALFDLAGTFIKPDPPVEIQYENAAKEILPAEFIPPRRTIRERFRVAFESTGPYDDELRYGTSHTEAYFFWKRILQSVFPTADDQSMVELVNRLYDQFERAESWSVMSGAEPVLGRLRENPVTTALVTNWDLRCRSLVSNLSLDHYFDRLFISSEVGAEKPDPEFFGHVLKETGVTPEHTLMVGNKPSVDLEPADNLGMYTLLLVEGEHTALAEHLWPSVAHSWLDIANWLMDEGTRRSDS